MSTTTTNFGWTVPSDTDLVKDGAAAIRTALGGVDTSFVDLKGGTTGQLLSKASGTDLDFIWASPTTSSKVVQMVNVQTGAVATGTGTIPFDDTIPQNTEGTQFMSLSITPTSATNILVIDVIAFVAPNQQVTMQGALFQDSTANALAASLQVVSTNNDRVQLDAFRHYMVAGTTSATTFKYRSGANAAATVTFNGRSGSRLMGGVMASSITITEYTP